MGTFSKCSHLIGNYSKTAAMGPRSRSFNGGIKGEQVGLLSNAADHIENATNLL